MKVASLVAAAGMLVTLNVHAQGSVTLFGLLDVGVTFASNESGHRTVFFGNDYTPNLIGFLGREVLGGGTDAVFRLVSQFDPGSGATLPAAGQLFNREAYVGLDNARFGHVLLGNQYEFMRDSLLRFDASLFLGSLYGFRQGPFAALGIPNNPTGAEDFDRVAGATRVPNSVKYQSPSFAGFSLGAMYGFGGVPGNFAADRTISAGANYSRGPLGLGAAYTDTRYAQLNNGHDGIRNWGVGGTYAFGDLLTNLLYTNTRNTLSGGSVAVYQIGANYRVTPSLQYGADYEFMKGNSELLNNKAHEITTTLAYSLSKRTTVYLQVVYQNASGDGRDTQAWISGLVAPSSKSSNGNQLLGRIGLATTF
jgi:predicted porin